MERYLLTRDMHVCVHGSHLVILDLRSGRYRAIPETLARTLSGQVAGWPLEGSYDVDHALLARLVDEGILTLDQAAGKLATPTTARPPTRTLADLPVDRYPNIRTS